MITKRTLEKWRREALNAELALKICEGPDIEMEVMDIVTLVANALGGGSHE